MSYEEGEASLRVGAANRSKRSLEGATMPDGQTLKSDKIPHRPTYEEWLKDKEGREENREKPGSS
jgi:hypothetical protein